MGILNPFGLTGWQAMLSTGVVCLTVFACVASVVTAVIKVAEFSCNMMQDVAASVRDAVKDFADAWVVVRSGKGK